MVYILYLVKLIASTCLWEVLCPNDASVSIARVAVQLMASHVTTISSIVYYLLCQAQFVGVVSKALAITISAALSVARSSDF